MKTLRRYKKTLIIVALTFVLVIKFVSISAFAKDWILSSTYATDNIIYIDVTDKNLSQDLKFNIFDSGEISTDSENELYNMNLKDKTIQPGQAGEFNFVLDNISGMDINTELFLTEYNDYKIPLHYKLRKITGDDSEYIIGGEDTYESISSGKKLSIEMNDGERAEYVLYWAWLSSGEDGDKYDNYIGEVAKGTDVLYTINILIYAEEAVNTVYADLMSAAKAGLIIGGGCVCSATAVVVVNSYYLRRVRILGK